MAKLFAVTVILIAIGSAIPILMHTFVPPVDISTHGPLIDEQMSETMAEAGISFLAAQIILGVFVWKFSRTQGRIGSFPGGARGLVAAAVILVGVEVFALGAFGARAWAGIYFTAPGPNAMRIQAQAGQFAFYFRYPGPDGKFGPLHPDLINEGTQNFFGLDPDHDPEAKDDIVTAELAVPVNREIHLLMHAKDVGHSFFVRELRIQQDFVPGLDVSVHFTTNKVGRYEIVCTQLCGLGHYNMKAYLNVMSQADFDAWLKQQASQQ
ncbi:MAG: cytochrome C oxidase subunit II [Acidobacteria bacterium]|nr:cytochrome C oxidase subunit II [Acidobacteriota bacterium]MBV8893094.1 cytochrome C oxidase subunit II [Acidobacteriota bacterium]MBV9482968.1 cytochrome C oxidase subunit II [Acidobacteriota bacterium]